MNARKASKPAASKRKVVAKAKKSAPACEAKPAIYPGDKGWKAKPKPKLPKDIEAPLKAACRRSEASLKPFRHLLTKWQIDYLLDRSRLKKLVKSRRIGGTWVQALEDVLDCIDTPGLSVWFSSADKTSGVEYIEYLLMWVGVANLLVQTSQVSESDLDDVEFDDDEPLEVADESEATATVVKFHNGSRVTVLSSNPSQFRSKGGKVVIDEFAHHKRDRELWKAAQPVAARGHAIRIISTQNGMSCVFYRLGNKSDENVSKLLRDKYEWSNHLVTIVQAVDEGMLDQIEGRPTSAEERAAYIASLRAQCLNEAQYLEEYMGIAQDEAHALLPYALIESVEREGILGLSQATGPLYLGMDVARRRDLTVIYVLELCGMVLHTRHLVVLEKSPYRTQKKVLWELLRMPRLVRASIDATGIGNQLAEEAQDDFGVHRVEAVIFTAAIKDAIATRVVQEFQDSAVLVSVDSQQKEGLHAVVKMVSITNQVRYDAKHDEENGHGDHFWALGLAIAAARSGSQGPVEVISCPLRVARDGMASLGSINHKGLESWASMR